MMEARITEVDGTLRLEVTGKTNNDEILLNRFFSVYHRGPKFDYAKEDDKHVMQFKQYVTRLYLIRQGWVTGGDSETLYKYNLKYAFNTSVEHRLKYYDGSVWISAEREIYTPEELRAAIAELDEDDKINYEY